MTDSERQNTFSKAYSQLRTAQKDSSGAPVYARFVNRPLGRIFAAAAFQLGLMPNQVTVVSGLFTFAGIGLIAALPASWATGIAVAVLLMIGYALDSADGQLARLRGGGTAAGEWLDHMVDSVKLASIHLAVLISFYRNFELPSRALLLIPICFGVVQMVHFFGMIVTDLIARERHARAATGDAFTPPSRIGANHSTLVTLARLPVDYGLSCLVFLSLGAHRVFFVLYGLTFVAWTGYLLLALIRWYRLVSAFDRSEAEHDTV